MKKKFVLFVSAVLLVALAACSVPTVNADYIQSDKPQDTSPEITAADLAALVAGNTDFALSLYQQLRNEDENLFYSPYSLSVALAMTYAGARGETEQQMAEALNFYLSQDRLHPAFNFLYQELSSRGVGAASKDGEGFRLHTVNDIWGQKDYSFLTDFLDTLAVNYGAGLRILDFVNSPEESRQVINDYISEQTEGKIEELIPEGIIDFYTRLVLTNAIYFNAAWKYPFDEENTADGTFYLLDGTAVTVPMMFQSEFHGYTEGDGYQAVELLYDGDELSMVIILPDAGEFRSFEASLNAAMLNEIINSLAPSKVSVTLPKWEFEASFMLKETLAAMGMPIAFSEAADFSGMNGNTDLFIGEVMHKAFVSVDEAGTEAAAASAVEMQLSGMPQVKTFTADRPFIFLIRDIETGTVLFMGRVLNPEV